ncbi:unnamed protein product [Phytomonas sp. EM1]|nr:unnamed protein product [Phytomonas sp. EM1]|eukprot:CCW62249.1 unnamed protein product [Phytomonas sp. isolate EM1]
MVDRVQLCLSAIDGDHSGLDLSHSVTAAAPSVSSTPNPQPLPRTKIVFLYSDEEEDSPRGDNHPSTGDLIGTTNTLVNGADHSASLPLAPHTRVVPCPDPLQPDPETLMELQADALNAKDGKNAEQDHCEYREDVVGSVSESFPVFPTPSAEGAWASVGIRTRVVPITPHGLTAATMGGPKTQGDASSAGQAPLRRGLTTEELARFQSRKRLRDDSDEDVDECGSDPSQENNTKGGTDETREESEIVEAGLEAIVDEDGSIVRAIRNGPYCLTVDERDLIEEDQGLEDGPASCEKDGMDSFADVAADALPNGSKDECDLGDDYDEDDEDSSDAEYELDECLVVAVVEQLVRCCESDDLDPKMEREASRFLSVAKPLLAQLEDETISSSAFAQLVDRDVRRFNRIFRSVYRPRDEPIVIDGVQMDL